MLRNSHSQVLRTLRDDLKNLKTANASALRVKHSFLNDFLSLALAMLIRVCVT